LRAVDPTTNWIHDQAAAFRSADEELCRALRELQLILDRQEVPAGELANDELYREWVLSLSVIREALQAVERIAHLLTLAETKGQLAGPS
jgi:hypothetical protein